jgi:antitoxin (DNA-binding transcriptional repressor) of toxin-antitoxin stability system
MEIVETATGKVMSVGQLRQNPTPMVHDVEIGISWVLTNHGRPFGRVVPYVQRDWIPVSEAIELLNTPTEPSWLAELEADRAATTMRDPWMQ